MTIDMTGIPQPTKARGRKAPPLPTYEFPDVGVTVQIRRLGPFTMDEIRKKLAKDRQAPKPPVIPVEIGEMRVKMQEPNPNDPAYRQELAEYDYWLQTSVGEKMMELMINYCIVADITDDEAKEAILDKRAVLALIDPEAAETYGDKEVYIRHYLITSPAELTRLQQFILGQSMPTPEAVEQHIEAFPGDVQGETPVLTPGVAIRV